MRTNAIPTLTPDSFPAPPPPASRWHGLDPLTRLVVSLATVVAAMLLHGAACLLSLGVLAVLAPALAAGVSRRVALLSLAGAAPLVVSVILVNVFFSVGGTVVAEMGPFEITREGIDLAATVTVRLLVMAGAVVLFYLTTRPSQLVTSLQSHGVSARATFVIHNAVAMIPRLTERAGEVTDAQRARGLDTEGRWWRRARGVVALASPTVLGAIHEVETRTLAMETRGFTRPGRPTLLWQPADSATQRLLRWGIAAGLLALGLARLAGVSLPC
jgi:energy-coupling factor transport system permease protein